MRNILFMPDYLRPPLELPPELLELPLLLLLPEFDEEEDEEDGLLE